MDKVNTNNPNGSVSILKNIFNKDFVIGAIIPIIIFTVLNKYKMPLYGVILSGLWSIGVVVINYIKKHEINALATIAAIISAIGLVGTVISKNTTFYLISPIIQDFLYAALFFSSLFLERSLIQIIVEQTYLKNVPENFRKTAEYKAAWKILTVTWGVLNISQAVLRIVLLYSVSMSSYYAISTLYSNISGPILLAVSLTFPKWYWSKKLK